MSEKKIKPSIFQQLEDALEERQNADRRKQSKGTPPGGVVKERRMGSRRTSKSS